MGRKIIHKEPLTLTTSSGTATGTTNQFLVGLMREVLVQPTTSTTTYTITITSPQGLTIFQTTTQVGDMADETAIPIRGANVVTISSASADEAFTISLIVDQ